ncbi:carbonic anhydrase family protein [Aquimarina muelleri]|uniref:Carbonic anhydrase n=1 Tax=Aquimarina muelleri TaxID=279356 RepID=A0A918JYK7_9FLAO|nr:carbonic anhydrase family protein [Aquimarina muelleri]MCX2764712.1 carbonic anhydrase family protein [Aquimarina muelleri]GGX33239.1 carbonic anhydrase [Aquimarina muelleri]
MITQTKRTQDMLTPVEAYRILKEGNKRFEQNLKAQRNLKVQVIETSMGQYPFAAVLSCIDSRVPVELVFDLGIGDVFSIRIAGNVVNKDVLGSIEYACKVAGSKIVVVMGHTRCGAVKSACNKVELGNITSLLSKIKPAVQVIENSQKEMDEKDMEKVAIENVQLSIDRMKQESEILFQMEKLGKIQIVGAIYSVSTGRVDFFESDSDLT